MNEQIVRDLSEYRKLKEDSVALDERMKPIKARLLLAVEAEGGKVQDETGYARIVQRKASMNCKNSLDLYKAARVWAKSEHAAVEVIGKTVCGHFSQKNGYSYLQIK